MNQKSLDKKKTKELEWEKELISSGKHLADILEQYNGNRQCKLCGAEPEKQSEWVIFLVKKLLTQQRTELLEEILEENFCDLDGTYDYDGIAQSVIDLHKKL